MPWQTHGRQYHGWFGHGHGTGDGTASTDQATQIGYLPAARFHEILFGPHASPAVASHAQQVGQALANDDSPANHLSPLEKPSRNSSAPPGPTPCPAS